MARRKIPLDLTGASGLAVLGPGEIAYDDTDGFRAGNGISKGGDVLLADKLAPRSLLKKLPRRYWDDLLSGTISPSVDLTGWLQEAADEYAGQTIAVPPLSLFIRKTLFVRSGTKLMIDPGCVMRANTDAWIDSGIEETLTGDTRQDVGFLIANANYDADDITDSGIQIIGGKFIRDANGAGNQGHAILMRRVRGVLVDNISVENGWNATAFLACRDTIVTNSYAHNVRNCGFDAWEGAGNVKVDKVTVRNDPGKEIAQGIQVSGMATDGDAGDSFAFQITNSTGIGIRSPDGHASAIIANAIGLGSSVRGGVISGNVVDDADNGLVVQGDVSAITGDGNVLRGVSKAPVLVIPDLSGLPSNISIDAMLVNCSSDNALGAIHGNRNDVRIRLVGSNPATRTVRFEGTATNCRAIIRGPVNENVPVQDDNPSGKNSASWDDVDESVVFTRGSGDANAFTVGWTFRQLLQAGATGHHEAVHFVNDARSHGIDSKFLVGLQMSARTDSGGLVFGGNSYGFAGQNSRSSTEVCGHEFNTDVRAPVITRKFGAQIVDVATSVGYGSILDGALYIGRQAGALGYGSGFLFGDGIDTHFPLKNGTLNALLSVKAGSDIAIGYGIDFGAIQYGQAALALRAQIPGHRISWGIGQADNREGGEIRSDASSTAGKIIFTNGGATLLDSVGTSQFSWGTSGVFAPGMLTVGSGVATGDANALIGAGRTGNGNALVDLYGAPGALYGSRFLRSGGANGDLSVINAGSGSIIFSRAGINQITLSAAGITVASSLVPSVTNAANLGSVSARFANMYGNENPNISVVTSGASYSVAGADKVVVVRKTVGSPTAIALPGPSSGRTIIIKDGKGDAATNNITITPASGTIDGAASIIISTNRARVSLTFDGSEWVSL